MKDTIKIYGIFENEKQIKACDIIQDDLNQNKLKFVTDYIESPKGFTFKEFIIYDNKDKITAFINRHKDIITTFKNRLVLTTKNI